MNKLLGKALLLGFICSTSGYAFQGGERPDTTPKPAPKSTAPKSAAPKVSGGTPRKPPAVIKRTTVSTAPKVAPKEPNVARRPRTVQPATLVVIVNPPDSAVMLDGQELQTLVNREANGALRLKPGIYNIVARRDGYGEAQRTVGLSPGQNGIVEIKLTQLPGKLSITPNVAEAEITVSGKGSYTGSISELELVPGRYEIVVSKPGYQTATREVLVEPGRSSAFAVTLEPVKKRAPPITAMTLSASSEGKYVSVSLMGSSQTMTRQFGTIEVILNGGSGLSNAGNVTGMLSGLPCRVDLVPLENVAEISFKEPPGLSNRWERIVVRVRPKKTGRPLRFLISWQVIGATQR